MIAEAEKQNDVASKNDITKVLKDVNEAIELGEWTFRTTSPELPKLNYKPPADEASPRDSNGKVEECERESTVYSCVCRVCPLASAMCCVRR